MTKGLYERISGKCKLAVLLIPSFFAVVLAVFFGLSVAGVFVPEWGSSDSSTVASTVTILPNESTTLSTELDRSEEKSFKETKFEPATREETTTPPLQHTNYERPDSGTTKSESTPESELQRTTASIEQSTLDLVNLEPMSTIASSLKSKQFQETTEQTHETTTTTTPQTTTATSPTTPEISTTAEESTTVATTTIPTTSASRSHKPSEKDSNSSKSRNRGKKQRNKKGKRQKDANPKERNRGGRNRTTSTTATSATKSRRKSPGPEPTRNSMSVFTGNSTTTANRAAQASAYVPASNTNVTNSNNRRVGRKLSQRQNHRTQNDEGVARHKSRRKKSDHMLSLSALSEPESGSRASAAPKTSEQRRNANDDVIYEIFFGAGNRRTVDHASAHQTAQAKAQLLQDTPSKLPLSSQKYQDACIRIPHPKCQAVLPYEFTPFMVDNSEDSETILLYKTVLKAMGVEVEQTVKLPKKKSAEKHSQASSSRSFLNPREVVPRSKNRDCDVDSLLRLVCHLRFPPCEDTANFTDNAESEQINTTKEVEPACNRWCSEAFATCLDLKTLLQVRTIYKRSNDETLPLGLIVKDTRYFGNTVVHSGILTLGVLTDDKLPSVVNGLETAGLQLLPESASFKNRREIKVLSAELCKRVHETILTDKMDAECTVLRRKSPAKEETKVSTEQDDEALPADDTCSRGFFRCKSGVCLDWNWTCNGQNDCGQWEDEIGCECSDDQLQCDNGQCVRQSAFCDGYHDCVDRSDERNCTFCEYGLYRCGLSRQCIKRGWWCDGDVDCVNGDDEKYCSCESQGQISCDTGNYCIQKHYRCDGDADCPDSSDERDCAEAIRRCAAWEISCGNKCVPVSAMCDGIRDCAMGEDEENCGQCETVELDACRETAYNVTSLPNFLRHQSQIKTAMSSEYVLFSTILHTRCHPLLRQLGCSILAPPPTMSVARGSHCPLNGTGLPMYSPPRLLPCRELCETVRSACSGILTSISLSWPSFLNCQSLPPENSPKIAGGSPAEMCLDYEAIERASCSVGEFRCATNTGSGPGSCLPNSARCDGVRHCSDGSDEISCDCDRLGRFSCGKSGRCIPQEWVCDGHVDCPNGFEESKCNNCTILQRRCDDYSCVAASRWCDGRVDCTDGSDEERCIKLIPHHHIKRYTQDVPRRRVDWSVQEISGIMLGWHADRWFPICAEGWSSLLSHVACNQMGFREAHLTTSHSREAPKQWLHANKHIRVKFVQESFLSRLAPCRNNRLLHLTCKPKFCGQKLLPAAATQQISSRVFGGRTARADSWPWIASLTLPGMRHVCGSTLIHPQWLISAAHCFQGRDDVSFWRAKFGAANQEDDASGVSVNISDIVIHPRFDSRSMDFDVALIRLEHALTANDGVAPACLTSVPTRPGAYCHIAGWGVTGKSSRGARKLQEGAVHVMDRVNCQRYYPKHVITDRMICAGHQSSSVDACSGDSGGPMTCWRPELRQWYLAGVTSWGSSCMPHVAPGVYTDIAYFSKWVRKTTEEIG